MENDPIKHTIKRLKSLEIQGAINVAEAGMNAIASYTEVVQARTEAELLGKIEGACALLADARATEPALRNGLTRVVKHAKSAENARDLKFIVKEVAEDYINEMHRATKKIVEIGEKRIRNDDVVFTHCHSSTVTKILRKAWSNGKRFRVVCTETRPLYQGHTTASELTEAGIPTTLIVDSASRTVMNDCDLVMLGADAITSDGNMVNKIGTSVICLVAHEARTPVSVATQTMKFDPITLAGEWEPIEERAVKEVWAKPPKGLHLFNPAFDVTPAHLIDFLITEEGVINPFEVGNIIREKYSV